MIIGVTRYIYLESPPLYKQALRNTKCHSSQWSSCTLQMFWERSVIHFKVSVFEISPCTPTTSRGQWPHPIPFLFFKVSFISEEPKHISSMWSFITFKKYWRRHYFLNVHHVREKTGSLQIAKADIFNRFPFKGLVSASHFKSKKNSWWRLEVRKEILSNGNLSIVAIKLTVYFSFIPGTRFGFLRHLLVRQRVPITQGLLFRRFLK